MLQTDVLEKIKTHFMVSKFSPTPTLRPEKRAVCEVMWKNAVEPGRPPMTIWRMRSACQITKIGNIYCFSTATMVVQNAAHCYVLCTLPVLLLLFCVVYVYFV